MTNNKQNQSTAPMVDMNFMSQLTNIIPLNYSALNSSREQRIHVFRPLFVYRQEQMMKKRVKPDRVSGSSKPNYGSYAPPYPYPYYPNPYSSVYPYPYPYPYPSYSYPYSYSYPASYYSGPYYGWPSSSDNYEYYSKPSTVGWSSASPSASLSTVLVPPSAPSYLSPNPYTPFQYPTVWKKK